MEKHRIDIAGNVFVIETPDGFGALFFEAMAHRGAYEPEIVDTTEGPNHGKMIQNPVSKAEFAALGLFDMARAVVGKFRVLAAEKAARESTREQNETDREKIVFRPANPDEV